MKPVPFCKPSLGEFDFREFIDYHFFMFIRKSRLSIIVITKAQGVRRVQIVKVEGG
jgi:hypothetical protein